MQSVPYARHQFPPSVYPERGLDISYETIRRWVTRSPGGSAGAWSLSTHENGKGVTLMADDKGSISEAASKKGAGARGNSAPDMVNAFQKIYPEAKTASLNR